MTGSLQTKNGRFYMVISYKDAKGKHRNRWIATKLPIKGNKKAAQAMLEQWLHDHKNCDISYNNISFADYLEDWINKAQFDLQPSTIRGYRSYLKNHIIPYFRTSGVKLLDLRIRDFEQFYKVCLTKDVGLSPHSVRHCHRIISKSLNDAVRLEIIPSNPAALAKCPKAPRFVGAYLNLKQIQQLAKVFEGTPIEYVVNFICTYGLRRSEALGLCWDKVDFENNHFTVCRAMIQGDGENYLKNCTKNDSSYRTLPLTANMKTMLIKLFKQRMENKKVCGSSYIDNNLVFVWPDGSPITPNYLTRNFHKLIKKSSLPTIRLHDLRHSTASNLLSKNFSTVDVQLWLGHSQPSTTLNFYSHTDSSFKKDIQLLLEKELVFNEKDIEK